MYKKISIVLLLLFVSASLVFSVSVLQAVPNPKQVITSSVTLVGGLDAGIQTGSVTSSSYTLTSGFAAQAQPEIVPADFNFDQVVDFADFLIFAQGFGRGPSDPAYNALLDLNKDTQVDFADFLIFVTAFTR